MVKCWIMPVCSQSSVFCKTLVLELSAVVREEDLQLYTMLSLDLLDDLLRVVQSIAFLLVGLAIDEASGWVHEDLEESSTSERVRRDWSLEVRVQDVPLEP